MILSRIIVLLVLVGSCFTTIAYAGFPATVTAATTSCNGITTPATCNVDSATTLDVDAMTVAAGSGNTALFETFFMTFTASLSINCLAASTWTHNANLVVRIINGMSATSTLPYFILLSGPLSLGSSVSVVGGTYTYTSNLASLIKLDASSSILDHSSISVTYTTITHHNVNSGGTAISLLIVYVASSPSTFIIDDYSSLLVEHNTIDVLDMVSTANSLWQMIHFNFATTISKYSKISLKNISCHSTTTATINPPRTDMYGIQVAGDLTVSDHSLVSVSSVVWTFQDTFYQFGAFGYASLLTTTVLITGASVVDVSSNAISLRDVTISGTIDGRILKATALVTVEGGSAITMNNNVHLMIGTAANSANIFVAHFDGGLNIDRSNISSQDNIINFQTTTISGMFWIMFIQVTALNIVGGGLMESLREIATLTTVTSGLLRHAQLLATQAISLSDFSTINLHGRIWTLITVVPTSDFSKFNVVDAQAAVTLNSATISILNEVVSVKSNSMIPHLAYAFGANVLVTLTNTSTLQVSGSNWGIKDSTADVDVRWTCLLLSQGGDISQNSIITLENSKMKIDTTTVTAGKSLYFQFVRTHVTTISTSGLFKLSHNFVEFVDVSAQTISFQGLVCISQLTVSSDGQVVIASNTFAANNISPVSTDPSNTVVLIDIASTHDTSTGTLSITDNTLPTLTAPIKIWKITAPVASSVVNTCGNVVGSLDCQMDRSGVYPCYDDVSVGVGIRIRDCNRTITLTTTQSQSSTTSFAETQSIEISQTAECRPVPLPLTYFATGLRRLKYVHNDFHQPIATIPSGIPCGFTTECSDATTTYNVRYITTSPYDTYLGFILDTRDVTTADVRHAITKGSLSSPSSIITTDMGVCDNFHKFTCDSEGYFDNPLTNPNVTCGALLLCRGLEATRPVPAGSVASVSTTSSPLSSSLSLCSSVFLGGVITSSVPFHYGPLYGYVVRTSTTLDENSTINTFKSGQWRGHVNSQFTSPGGSVSMIVVGNDTSPSVRPAPVQQDYIGVAHPQDSRGITPLNITGTTASSVVCSVGEVRGFTGSLVAPNTPLDALKYGAAVKCFTHATVNELQLACSQSPSCVGFTTVRVDDPVSREEPMCLHISDHQSIDTPPPYARMFYRKPSTAATPCTTTVERSGNISVYVLQSAFKTNTVVVRVNSVVTVCGGANGFSNGFNGLDDRCDVMALCYSGHVGTGSTIEVTPSNRLSSPNGCKFSFRTVIEQISVDTVQIANPEVSPIARVNTSSGFTSRPVRATSSVAALDDSSTYPIFVYRGTYAALDVTQTGYDCALYQQKYNEPCPTSTVSMTTTTACQSCGSQSGFYINNTVGFSDRCDISMYCGDAMPLVVSGGEGGGGCTSSMTSSSSSPPSSVSEYTGTIRVTSDHAKQAFLTSQCSYFNGRIEVQQQPSTTGSSSSDSVPIYPLLISHDDIRSTFRILPTAPTTLSVDDALSHATLSMTTSLSPTPLTTSSLQPLTYLRDIGPQGSGRLRTYYSPTSSYLPSPNSTFVCIIDHAAGGMSSCTFDVPSGTTQVRILVSQTDFANASKEISIDINAPLQPTYSRSTTCGGGSSFTGVPGQQDQCNTYSTCLDQNIFSQSGLGAASSTTISLTFPAHIRSHSCDHTAAVVVTFFSPPPSSAGGDAFSCSSSSYQCPFQDKCIDWSSFCDGFRDCNSGVDENSCGEWYPLNDEESFCVPAETVTNFTVISGAECLSHAAMLGSAAFTLSSSGACSVYAAESTATIFNAPSVVICVNSTSSVQTYVRLPLGPLEYTRCTASIHCSGHGTIGNIDPQDGDACICLCFAGYTGDTCSQQLKLETIELIVAHMNIHPSNSSLVSLARVASVLELSQRRISVDCSNMVPSPQNTSSAVLVECTVSSLANIVQEATSHQTTLLSTASLTAINTALATTDHPLIEYISTSSPMTPLLALTNCSTVGGACEALTDFVRVRITARNATSLSTINVEVASPNTTVNTNGRSQQHHLRRQLSCTPTIVSGTGGCVVSTCELDLAGPVGSVIRVVNSTYDQPTLLTGLCIDASIIIDQGSKIGNVQTATTDTVFTDWGDFTWLLNGSIITFIVGFFVVVMIGVICLFIYYRRKGAFERSFEDETFDSVMQFKVALLARFEYMHNIVSRQRIRLEHVGVCAISSALVLGIVGAFLAVFYVTASFSDSTFTILYEEYPDSLCDNSPTSSMPRRIFAVSPKDTICTKQSVTGETTGSVFARGYCSGSGGVYNAILKSGSSFSDCEDDAPRTLPSGMCIHLTAIDPKSTRNVFVRLTCSLGEHIENRTTTLETLTTTSDNLVPIPTTNVPGITTPSSSEEGAGNTIIYRQQFAVGSTVAADTSHHPETFASVATSSNFDDNPSLGRLVLQDVHRTFKYPDSTTKSSFSLEDELHQPSMGNLSLSALSSLIPHNEDYPIGHVFGRFTSGAEDTWLAAATQAHRHYHIQGSLIDVGAAISSDSHDDAGFTVSMYLRATESTRGFAYAVTDAFENKLTNQVYALDRLAGIIENGKPSSFWFNTTYKVYSSLFVDGPGRTLSYATADTDREPDMRVEVLDWNLDRIGTEYLFNGLWHHVAIVFKVDGGKRRAQLIVDGDTSESQGGWSVCVNQTTPKIQTLPNPAPVFSELQDRVSQGGLLVVGYLNGAVHSLTSTHTPLDSAGILATGSDAMRDHNAFPRSKTAILGGVMIALAALGILGCIVTVYMLVNTADTATHTEVIMTTYFNVLAVAMHKSYLENECDSAAPVMKPIRFSTALRWTKLNAANFGQLLTELQRHTDQVPMKLFSILLRVRIDDPTADLTMTLWNSTVENDEQQTAEGCIGKTDEEVDCAMSNGIDPYTSFIASMDSMGGQQLSSTGSPVHRTPSNKNGTEGDLGRMINGRNATLSTGSGGGGSAVASLGPVVTVFQSIGVWSSSLSFPSEFMSSIGTFSSFLSVDFVTIFAGLESIVIPLAQLFIGLFAMCLLVYVLIEDEHFFENNLCRYVWKRDNVEGVHITNQSATPSELTQTLDDQVIAEPRTTINVLDGPQCAKIDNTAIKETSSVDISDTTWSVYRTTQATALATYISPSDCPVEVDISVMGRYCPAHPTTLLAPTYQDDVIPFTNSCACCIVVGDRPCGSNIGKLYTCGTKIMEKDGIERLCVHAVCEQHMRATFIKHMQVLLISYFRTLRSRGFVWAMTVIILAGVGFLYTPIVKTALMILVCHPYYQCEFGLCYDFITQKFAVAVFLSGVIIVFLGIGFPAALMYALQLRQRKLDALFFSPEYEGKFETNTEGVFSGKRVTVAEWARFINTDGSALQKHYGTSAYHWLYLPALFILFKVLIIVPIVALEIGSFEQRLGTCIVEMFIAGFVFLTTSTFSPALLVGLRVSSVHQLLQLGLLNIDLVTRHDSNVSLGAVMVGVTVVYLILTVALLASVLLGPVLYTRIGKRSVTNLLLRAGIDSGSGANLWCAPSMPEYHDFDSVITSQSQLANSPATLHEYNTPGEIEAFSLSLPTTPIASHIPNAIES